MNYIFKLFLPVAASAMILGQVTTAQANENKGGKGGGGHHSGGTAQVHSGGGKSHGTATKSTARTRSVTHHKASYHLSSAVTTKSNAIRSTTTSTRSSFARTSNGIAGAHGTTLALTRNGANIAGVNTQARFRAGMGGANPSTTIASNRFAYRAGTFHPNWIPGQTYYWNNCRWQCYNGVWAVFGVGWPFNWYAYPYPFWYDNWLYYAGDAYQPASSNVIGGGTAIVANVQQDLISQGYNPGPTDGLMGPHTGNAIAAYQKDHGLPPTGQINGPLLNSLGL